MTSTVSPNLPVKIMVLIPTWSLTGPMKGVLQLIEHSDPGELQFRIYGFRSHKRADGPLVEALRSRGVSVRLLEQGSRSYYSLVRQVVQQGREGGFQILQTHGFKPTFLAFASRGFSDARWICFMHGTTNENLKVRGYNLLDSLLQRAAHRTVLVSESQRRRIVGGKDRNRVRVVHNAVDPDHPMPTSPHPAPLREHFGLSAETPVIVSVGRFSPEKGMDILLEAFAQLRPRNGRAHLVLVGDGQERPSLEASARRLGLGDTVHFPGYTETPGDFVEGADAFVLPSRSEGIPNAILEAMALGVPVVATAVGGVPEILEDGLSGLLVPPERPELLAEALVRVLTKSELSRGLAEEGKKRIQTRFSVQRRLEAMRALYREVLETP